MLFGLRTLADAVLIGTGTLRAQGYARAPSPPTPSGAPGGAPRGWRTTRCAGADHARLRDPVGRRPVPGARAAGPESGRRGEPPGVPAPVEVVHMQRPTLAGLRAGCARARILSLLCEAGPTLHGALQREGLLGELFFAVAPLLRRRPRRAGGGEERAGSRRAWTCGSRRSSATGRSSSCGTPYRVRALRIEGQARSSRAVHPARGGDRAALHERGARRDDRRPERGEGRGAAERAGRASSVRSMRRHRRGRR